MTECLARPCFWVCHAWLSLLFSHVGEHAERCGKVLQIYAFWDGLCINTEKRLEDWMLTSPGLRASGSPASDECGCDLRLHPEAFDCVVAAVQLHQINAMMPALAS